MEKVKAITEAYMNGCLRVLEYRNRLVMLLAEIPNEDINAIAVILADAFEAEEA